jgi:exodeoxyribonuclease V gamma subunit
MQLFFLASNEHDDYLLTQLEDLRESWLETCESVALHDELPLTVVREAWLAGLDQGRLSQRFLAGAVNFCTLMPMRAIPFKLVCLLGMNDGDYPRAQPPLDFDLMGSDYRPGDRSRREDDRYLMLEALLSAREKLYISWVGRSIRDNSERPPSVLVGQLRDHLASGWRLADGKGSLLDALTQEHPLQPFSARYFYQGDQLFSYATEWRVLHDAQDHMQMPQRLAPYVQEEPLGLGQLQDFLRNPVRHFFSQRLKVFFETIEAPLADDEPFVLDALQRYSLGDSLLEAALIRLDQPDLALQAHAKRLQNSGLLPMAGFGESLQRELIEPLPDLLQRYQQLLALWPTPLASAVPISLQLAEVSVEGWLSGLHQRSDGAVLAITAIPNSIGSTKTRKWHRLIRPWVNHLVACASGLSMTTALVASDDSLLLAPFEEAVSRRLLGDLLQAWQTGMREPLPIAVKTAFAWLGQSDPGKAEAAARKAYEGDGLNFEGERRESPALARQFADFDALVADETFPDWCDALYRPLFEAPWRSLADEDVHS